MNSEERLPSQLLPLALSSSGDEIVIVRFRGGKKMRARLQDLGLHPGGSARVIKNERPGPLIIAVKEDSRLAVGRGLAQHILVSIQ